MRVAKISRSTLFFLGLMGAGALMVVLTTDVFFFWLGMEVMSLSFLGYLSTTNHTENIPFYFLPSAAASLCFLLGGVSETSPMMMAGLLMKLGAVPFHFWVPSTMKGLDWLGLWLLLGPMKLAPAWGLTMYPPSWIGVGCLLMGTFWASIKGIWQQTSYGLIAYLSIVSGGWSGLVASVPEGPAVIYLICFIIMSGAFLSSTGSGMSFLMVLTSLGLAGMPPGPIFVGKWAVYQQVVSVYGVYLGMGLAVTSVFSFAMMLGLVVYKCLTSGKTDATEVGILLLIWLFSCFLFAYWWWFPSSMCKYIKVAAWKSS